MCCGNITVETVANLFNIADVPITLVLGYLLKTVQAYNMSIGQPVWKEGDELIPFTIVSGPERKLPGMPWKKERDL